MINHRYPVLFRRPHATLVGLPQRETWRYSLERGRETLGVDKAIRYEI
jgi:hypothetical protein